ncbi:hypothetical protein MMC29_001379 [Sticta canariensis]|nr:hypothetical protein [Sticta canariensis]
MRPPTPSALRAIHHCRYPKACHSISNRYFVRAKSSFLTSPIGAKQQDDHTKGPEPAFGHTVEEPAKLPRSENNSKEAEETISYSEGGPSTPAKPVDKSNYGSAMNRAYRNVKKPKDIPTLKIPQWFLDSNVILREVLLGMVNGHHFHHEKREIPTATPATEPLLDWLEEEKSTAELNPGKLETSLTDESSESVTPAKDQDAEVVKPLTEMHSKKPWMPSNEKFSLPVTLQSENLIEKLQKPREIQLGKVQKGEELQNLEVTERGITKDMKREISKQKHDSMESHEIDAEIRRPYQVDTRILHEIISLVSAGLKVSPAQHTKGWTSSKSDLVLFCPVNGGSFFLDELVIYLAAVNGTDLVRLDPQDIAEIGGNYLEERRDTHAKSLSSLGYDAYRQNSEQAEVRESQDTEDSEEENESENVVPLFSRNQSGPKVFHATVISLPFKGPYHPEGTIQSALANGSPSSSSNSALHGKNHTRVVNATRGLKMDHFIETLLDTSDLKRTTKSDNKDSRFSPQATAEVSDISTHHGSGYATSSDRRTESLIVMVKDYLEISSTDAGRKVLVKLHDVVSRRRKDGQKILVIGTSSSQDLISNLSKSNLHQIESEPDDGPTRTVVVPCDDGPLGNNHQRRIGLINSRNLQDMLRRLAPSRLQTGLDPLVLLPSENSVLEHKQILFLLRQHIWPLDYVHFAATVTLGLLQDQEQLTAGHVLRALYTRSASDDAKFEWMDRKTKQEKISNILSSNPRHLPLSSEAAEERMSRLRKTCTTHETRLLSGVIDASSIRTTFADIKAPPETIDTLKTLISLSLVRPDAFTYGVLATDRIPGLLLYGPPGTGKTLLAKAVAKESGATVLEVSGSDINDMYVGEGEKNVKAIFSLAKKLTPCIVFIDEADAILGSRGGSSPRTSHRELINQFLREWDGMNDHSAFIMVATNRPYDLDEACLRRLPRRLLVDLPTEQDREAILRIHLKDEGLDPTVSIPTLASQTPFYSGSDLKNVAVAAALSCVREEVQQAATAPQPSSTLKETNQAGAAAASFSETISPLPHFAYPISAYPEKRTLLPRHFTRALEEISASISEDMGSLRAIRKFDEKYGDRRGRKKGMQGYGFNTVKEGDKNRSDAARVRN